MRTAILLVLSICLTIVTVSAEVVVQDPVLTITGHYRSSDGRVKEHKFPVVIKLLANGKSTGVIESWIEERLSDGTSNLDYFSNPFSGTWKIEGETIHITVDKGNVFPRITFKEMNGLKIKIMKKKTTKEK
jgi:hypothetical protein